MKTLLKHYRITKAILYCAFTDPMTDHKIWWNDDADVWVTHGRTWTFMEYIDWLLGRK